MNRNYEYFCAQSECSGGLLRHSHRQFESPFLEQSEQTTRTYGNALIWDNLVVPAEYREEIDCDMEYRFAAF